MAIDPFEEFEFKPLTEGLGFHKKKAAAAKKSDFDSSFEVTKPGQSLSDQGLTLLEDEDIDPLRPPLPRKANTTSADAGTLPAVPFEIDPAPTTANAVDEILKTLQKNRRLDFDNNAAAAKTKAVAKATATTEAPAEKYVEDVWNFSSGLLDSMLVIASSLLCMIIVLVVTKADLIANLSNPDAEGMVYFSTFALLATVSFIYLVVNRVFIGSTPGEWAFEQRIGKPADLNTPMYTVHVIARALLVIATGFVILPALSLIMKKDMAGEITQAKLLKKV